ncbi:MAG: hypothetical protein KatS3mg057_2409 [Herpetosiphonaceae bacterium]|nr:MAG: hypothetical protein KatS3mg057_2409 [Herpetosiphonaceae bacterium]
MTPPTFKIEREIMTSVAHIAQRSHRPLHLDEAGWRMLLEQCGPSLGLWRAAEVAALREQRYERPILDLGCGDGLMTSLVLPQVELGLDPWPQALAQAARRGIYKQLLPLTIEAALLPARSYATVISNSVLEHLERIDVVLQEIARVLHPGGRLIFTAPTEAFGAALALPLRGYITWRNRQLNHLNLWSVERWAERLKRSGLELEEARPYLRLRLVWLWDALELLQHIRAGRRRLFPLVWRRVPAALLDRLARQAARLDLSAPAPGGGRLIVARKR